jgi:hypothetical protein
MYCKAHEGLARLGTTGVLRLSHIGEPHLAVISAMQSERLGRVLARENAMTFLSRHVN